MLVENVKKNTVEEKWLVMHLKMKYFHFTIKKQVSRCR